MTATFNLGSAIARSFGVDGLQRSQVGRRRQQVTIGTVLGNAAHDLVRLISSRRNLAAIQIDGQRHITLVGKVRRLLLDPFVQAPPFVDDHQRRERPFALRHVENRLYRLVAAAVRHRLRLGCHRRHRKQTNQRSQQ